MPTLDQIYKIHDELGAADTLASYIKALRSIGVLQCITYVSDGHSEYYCSDGETLVSKTFHQSFPIADVVNKEHFMSTLALSEKGELGYVEMAKRLADSGNDRWIFDTKELTMSYLDKAGNILQKESLQDGAASTD